MHSSRPKAPRSVSITSSAPSRVSLTVFEKKNNNNFAPPPKIKGCSVLAHVLHGMTQYDYEIWARVLVGGCFYVRLPVQAFTVALCELRDGDLLMLISDLCSTVRTTFIR